MGHLGIFLPITVDSETDQYAWGATARLDSRYGITLYDRAPQAGIR